MGTKKAALTEGDQDGCQTRRRAQRRKQYGDPREVIEGRNGNEIACREDRPKRQVFLVRANVNLAQCGTEPQDFRKGQGDHRPQRRFGEIPEGDGRQSNGEEQPVADRDAAPLAPSPR